jgi:hypothetical protein
MNCQREAFDLWHPACRRNLLGRIKRGNWKYRWLWSLVIQDTWNRVCSKPRS